jgi:DNA replication licensing factor MCM3
LSFSVSRLKVFKASLFKLFQQEHAQSLSVDRVRLQVNEDNASAAFPDEELMAAIDKMQEDNQIMLSDNIIFLI